MRYDPDQQHRRSVRLSTHDYSSPGVYYVTICTQERECLFGEIEEGRIKHMAFGQVVISSWKAISDHWTHFQLDAFVVMPNHIHGIIVISQGEQQATQKKTTLGAIIAYFKYQSAKQINAMRDTPGARVWQRSYHDRVVRNEQMWNNARRYIADNPLRWADDVENPDNLENPGRISNAPPFVS